jgi:hypothetical protein
MPPCTATTLRGTPCSRRADEGGLFCTQHMPVPPEQKCMECSRKATQEGRCTLHFNRHQLFLRQQHYQLFHRNLMFEKATREIREGEDWKEVLHQLWLHVGGIVSVFPTYQDYIELRRDIALECDIHPVLQDPLYVDRQHLVRDWKARPPRIRFMEVIDLLGLEGGMAFADDVIRLPEDTLQTRVNDLLYDRMTAPPQPYRTELERLAKDHQNVHTREVNTQTAKMVAKLLVWEDGKDCRAEVWNAFRELGLLSVWRIQADVNKWYDTAECRTANDWLYRRCLNGLWRRICQHRNKDELVKRMYEECLESVGLCCDGHIARLCNSLVGFEEDFKMPMSVGEILQTKMSAIAMREGDREDKVKDAEVVFNELGIPAEERVAWLEAF